MEKFAEDKIEYLLQELLKYYRFGLVSRRINGIVHAINTPLQIILTQSELMERKLREEEDNFAPDLPAALLPAWQTFFQYRQNKNQQLQQVAHDLQKLVQWLKHHTYLKDPHSIQEIELNELILEELAGYQTENFYKHRVTKKLQLDRLSPIPGLYADFSLSICNLIDNAIDAMQEVSEPVLSITTTMDGGRRIIAVGDNGPGIPEEIQDKIFTPFFSTKGSTGKPQAGLGLFLSRRLLATYGGEIAFVSRPGQTWFRIILP